MANSNRIDDRGYFDHLFHITAVYFGFNAKNQNSAESTKSKNIKKIAKMVGKKPESVRMALMCALTGGRNFSNDGAGHESVIVRRVADTMSAAYQSGFITEAQLKHDQ